MKLATRARLFAAAITGRTTATPKIRMAGAGMTRLTKGWDAYQQSIDETVVYQLGTLRARARQLVESNGEAAGLLLDFESDIVGPAGARLQYRATRRRGTQLEVLNDRVEARFAAWGKTCTLDGAHDWPSLQRLVLRTAVVDGEFFAIVHRGRQYRDGIAYQPIDPDLVDDCYNIAPNTAGVSIVMGVEIDQYHKPLAYHVWDRHPSSGGVKTRSRIPAGDMLHVFKRVRVGQTRGITWFAPSLVTWKVSDQYTEAELVQSMLAAAQGGFFENPEGQGAFPMRTVTDGNGNRVEVPIDMEVEPGVSRALPGGWTFKPWQPLHPTANYVGFIKAIKRTISRAFGRAYASLTGDLSDVNFSSMRIDRTRETEQNKMHQADILVRQLAAPVFADWMEMASLTNALGPIPFVLEEMIGFATFLCRGWPWIDPLKDAAASQLAIQMRITSPQRVCAERGVDFFEIIDEIAEAQEYAEAKKVAMSSVEMALSLTADAPDETTKDTADGKPARSIMRVAA